MTTFTGTFYGLIVNPPSGGQLQTLPSAGTELLLFSTGSSITLTDDQDGTGDGSVAIGDDVTVSSGALSPATIVATMTNGDPIIAGANGFIYVVTNTLGQGDTSFFQTSQPATVCFAAGTRIETETGPRAVEQVVIGQMVRTMEGDHVAVKWIGRQTVSTRFGTAERLRPVRVRAGALDGQLPLRDLSLTADHALLIDGLLINAGALVNGGSIDYVPLSELGDSYTVYHIETEAHDVILAEGTPAETYIDYAARRSFDNYAEYQALYGEDRTIPEMAYPRISSARMLPDRLKSRLGSVSAA